MWAVELPLTLGFGSQIDKGEIDKLSLKMGHPPEKYKDIGNRVRLAELWGQEQSE